MFIQIFIITFIVLSFISNDEMAKTALKEPPELIISSESSTVSSAALGTYSWSYKTSADTLINSEAEAGAPPDLIMSQMESLTVRD